MADVTRRVPQNALGKFYVDDTCIYCDLCVEIVPAVYAEHNDRGWAYVLRQPQTQEETLLAIEAADACPTESIGVDGDQQQQAGRIQTLFQRLFRK